MTGEQHAVMWLGLLLIITRMFTSGQWGSLWATIGTSNPVSTAEVTAKTAPTVVKGGPVPSGNIQDWSAGGGTTSTGGGVQVV